MPLLISPIDGQSPMRQIHRYGIEIDICPVSGGIWLDRGEMEKLLQLMQEEIAASSAPAASAPITQERPPAGWSERPRRRDDDDDDDDDRRYRERGYYGSGRHHKKEGKMSRLMDLFDF